jgi:ABC-2 type transport system ATP-binding protein
MSDTAIIETENLTKLYKNETAVSGLSFNVNPGEIFGFLGPNGAGKTTTLLMLMGLTEPTSGKARVLGIDPSRDPIKVKRKIGYLQENMGFYRDMNAVQSLSYIAELNGIAPQVAADRIEDALLSVGLDSERSKAISAYSRGMRQRLGIAELLVKEPEVAFLDEPTLGLDPDTTNRILELIQALCAEKKMTVLLSSHMLNQVQRVCTRVGIMINGHMVAQGSMDQLAQEKLGIGQETYTLEEVYMKYFQES